MTAKASAWLAAVIAAAVVLFLGPMRPAAAQEALSEPQLEQLAAPIALYPDELIAQVLDAAQYPQDVAAASGWRSTVGASLTPDELAIVLRDKPWAASVKALVDVPDVLYAMSNDPSWTAALGRAHATQDAQLLAAIQDLRRRAEAAGTLRTVPQQVVEDDGQDIAIYPATQDGLYVPYYDPSLVYGDWPWSDYPPDFFSDMDWGPDIGFPVIVFVGPHWHHRHMDWDHDDRDHDGHWHGRNVAPAVGRLAAPAAVAAAAVPPRVVAGAPARTIAVAPAQRSDWISEQRSWLARAGGRGRALPPPAPATLAYPAPPRFPPPRMIDVPPVRYAPPRPIELPPVRMVAPAPAAAPAFHGFSEARSFSAPPAAHSFFGGGGHFEGRGRR